MKKSIPRNMICAGLFAACMLGTTVTGYAAEEEAVAAVEEGERPELPKDDGSMMAKVASVDGDSIAVYLSERKGAGGGTENGTPPEMPEGETADGTSTRPEPPADGTTPPEKPEGSTDDSTVPPERPEGEASDGTVGTPPEGSSQEGMGRGGMMENFSGEATTLSVSSSVVVTKGEGVEANLSDIDSDDIIRITFDEDGTTVTGIDIMDMEMPEMPETAVDEE